MKKRLVLRILATILLILIFAGMMANAIIMMPRTNALEPQDTMNITIKQAKQVTDNFLQLAQQQNLQALSALVDPAFLTPTNLNLIVSYINQNYPNIDINSGKVIGVAERKTLGTVELITTATTASEYQAGNNWIVINAIYNVYKDSQKIINVFVKSFSEPLEQINQISLSKLTFLRLLALALFIIVPFIIFITAIICIYENNIRYKWLWLIFILFGITTFNFDWTTQTFTFRALSTLILGADWIRASRYMPLIIQFSLPIGALIFLIKHNRQKRISRS